MQVDLALDFGLDLVRTALGNLGVVLVEDGSDLGEGCIIECKPVSGCIRDRGDKGPTKYVTGERNRRMCQLGEGQWAANGGWKTQKVSNFVNLSDLTGNHKPTPPMVRCPVIDLASESLQPHVWYR